MILSSFLYTSDIILYFKITKTKLKVFKYNKALLSGDMEFLKLKEI